MNRGFPSAEYIRLSELSRELTTDEQQQFTQFYLIYQLDPFRVEVHCSVYGEGEYRNVNPTAFRKKMPRYLLKKTAIAQAFRLAFPAELAGMGYDEAELSTDLTAELAPDSIPEQPTPKGTKTEKPANRNTLSFPRSRTHSASAVPESGPSETQDLVSLIHTMLSTNSLSFPKAHVDWIENDLPVEKTDTAFMIDTQEKATWAVRKIIRAESRITERSELAKSYKSRIARWLAEANRRDEASIESLSSLLTPYLREELAGSTKRRSIDLLGAKLGFRKLPERVEIVDPEKAITYCETNHPEALIIKKELSRAELRRIALKRELVPGVVLD